jgi:hypothetical protein
MSVLSFKQERERIFELWLSRVKRLLDRHLDREAAFEAWTDGIKRLVVIVFALGAHNVPANAASLSPFAHNAAGSRCWSSIPRQRSSSTPKGAIW